MFAPNAASKSKIDIWKRAWSTVQVQLRCEVKSMFLRKFISSHAKYLRVAQFSKDVQYNESSLFSPLRTCRNFPPGSKPIQLGAIPMTSRRHEDAMRDSSLS